MARLRLIQCGMGGMGRAWWNGAVRESEDFELAAIVDVIDAPLHEAGDALKIPLDRRFKSLAAALGAVRADAVLTVTPPPVHAEHAELAFSRGLHVLTEKPIADDLPAALRMVEQARAVNRQLVVAQNYRFRPCIQQLKRLIQEQSVGQLGHGHIDFYIPADFTGSFREKMEFPFLMDMAIHHLDLVRCVTGKNIIRVTTSSFNPPWSWYRHDVGLKMLLELEGGICFSYSGDWSARGRCTSWNGTWRLQCAGGAIHLEEDKVKVSRCEKWGNEVRTEPVDAAPMKHTDQSAVLSAFARSIRDAQPAETSGQDNLWSFAAVVAASISAKERGRPIDVPPLLGS
ncbi:MAG: Gfo/Idh/MocA family protein [Tepidisphaeraceae bacterium]